jgi:hypothetical protein
MAVAVLPVSRLMSGQEASGEVQLPADLILTGQLPPSWAALTSLTEM